jgi:pyruvate dehydrogenase E1 component alpha subunit
MLERQFSEAELDAIVAAIDAELERAAQFAFDSPFPGPEELRIDVFEEEIAA